MPSDEVLEFLLFVIVFTGPMFYLLLALVMYFTTIDANVDVAPAAENVLPDGAKNEWFDKAAEPLLREGFVDHGYWMMSIDTKLLTTSTVIRLLYHPATSTAVRITRSKAKRVLIKSVTASCSDAMGREVTTSNTRSTKLVSQLFSQHPNAIHRYLPWLKDPVSLIRAHQIFCKASGFGPWIGDLEPARFPSIVRAGLTREMEQQAELGLMRVKHGATFTTTEWGALVMAMRFMPGVRQWRRRRVSRKAREILRDAGWEG